MADLQKTILDLVRLGLRGDSASVRQYALRLLRKEPDGSDGDSGFREALTQLVLKSGEPARFARTSKRTVEPQPISKSAARLETHLVAAKPTLDPRASEVIDRILQERRSSDLLIKAGIEPATSVLLVGPPGTGKTMTARYIASTVGLPLITMDLAAVMSSYLGGTGQNIREALDLARQSPAVLFLDEFDALGKRRDDPSDVGELKRIVNVLLMEIENWPANGLLIAATNHPELLDRAVWRRFDLVVELQMPSAIERKEILSQLMLEHSRDVSTTQMDELVSLTYRMSGSDIARVTREALRRNALGADDPIEILIRGVVLQQLLRESASNPKSRALYAELSSRVLGHSYRQIADVLGVSHVTVGKLIRTSEKERISPL